MHALQQVKVSRDSDRWEVEIQAEIPAESLAKHREHALKELQKTVRLDGFRPGMAPVERIVATYGEGEIMRHAAEHAVQHELPELLAAEKLLVIESPRVSIEEPQIGKALRFSAKAALAPKVELPDYKGIATSAKAPDAVAVSDQEHNEALLHLRRERARIHKMETGTDPTKALEESRALDEKDLPALDDAFVQSLGYENTEKFSAMLRENIRNEKERQGKEKRRASILEEIEKKATISYPAILREYELDDIEARIKGDLDRIGRSFEEYLGEIKKTREELRADWKNAADKRAKVRLILAEIARMEKIDANPQELSEQIEHAKKHVPNADPEALRANIAHALRNEAVLNFLENQAASR